MKKPTIVIFTILIAQAKSSTFLMGSPALKLIEEAMKTSTQ
jgi:hypothetical protein